MSSRPHGSLAVLLASLLVALTLATGALAQDPPPYELPPTPTPTPTVSPEPELLTPVPIVRIVGSLTRRGALITRLSIRTPPLVRVVVRCGGRRGCPTRRRTVIVPDRERRMVTIRLRRFERRYRAGTVLQVKIAREGTIGKFVRFRVRRGRFPQRSDSCIRYTANKPSACPDE